jgi:CheY-like chemotaxis protein
MYGGKHHVRTAATLGEARRVLAEQPADIVISDQTMPEITGSDFLMEVSKAHPSSYRVLLTGSVGCAQVMPEIGSGIIHSSSPNPGRSRTCCRCSSARPCTSTRLKRRVRRCRRAMRAEAEV